MARQSKALASLIGNADRMATLLQYIRAGAYPYVAAGAIGIRESTWRGWMSKGANNDGRAYVALYEQVTRAVCEASVVAESSVLDRQPKQWLERGARRSIGDDWIDDARDDVNAISGEGVSAPTHADMLAALTELRRAGIDLNAIIDSKLSIADNKSVDLRTITDNNSPIIDAKSQRAK